MYILGVSCWYHDAAAVILEDGRLVAASEEERFSRIKHDPALPVNAVRFCLETAGITEKDLDYVVFYDKPIIKFDRIISTVISETPRSLPVFREAVPVWLREKLKFARHFRKKFKVPADRILFSYHHMSHAASAFFASPFEEAAILTVDGVGERATASIAEGKGSSIRMIREMRFPDSYGLLYSAFTAFLGFRVNNGEYKVMGMAPYGKPRHIEKIREIASISEDGSLSMNMDYFSFSYSTDSSYSARFRELFGEPRDPDSLFFTADTEFPAYFGEKPDDFDAQAVQNAYYADIAASIQAFLEEGLSKTLIHVKELTGMDNLCYAGGVALNSKANYLITERSPFRSVYIQPASTDAGGALGAALWCWHQLLGNPRKELLSKAYYGKEYSREEMLSALSGSGFDFCELPDDELYDRTAEHIKTGKVIAWYQGRTEWGPRALGNRSILADPRNPDMKNIVNSIIKFREPYRPFAPSIMEEYVDRFVIRENSGFPEQFMLVTYPVREEQQRVIPAVTHVNGTARIQSVKKDINPRYWALIDRFRDKTGVPVLLNTSFNLKGEPIVNSPADAVSTFSRSGIDCLVMGNILVSKKRT